MKIVYCIPSLHNSGGMERVLSQKANYLADKSGYDITIITSNLKGRKPFYSLSEKIKLYDLDIDYEAIMQKPLIKRISERLKAKKIHKQRLSQILNQLKADITISMFTHEMSFLPDIKDGSKKILELHFSKKFRKLDASSNGKPLLFRLINNFLDKKDRKSIKKYDKFVVLTQKDADDWGKEYSNINVIPNPVAFIPEIKAFNSIQNRILAVGRFCPQKGFDMLIDIWNLLPPNLKNQWHLDIIGDGPDKQNIQKKIDRLNLNDSVSLKERSTKITEEYKTHSILCFPSRYEGFPLALLEGMSFGLVPIAFDCPCGPSEIIQNEESGYLIKPFNIVDFASRLEYLMNNTTLINEMSCKASSFIHENFNEEKIMNKWINIFNNI